MAKSYCQIGREDIKQILSAIYGEPKRIPLASILMDIEEDDSVKNAASLWYVTKEDVRDHFGILQGVLIMEAALQSIICIVEKMRLFPGHKPAFLGADGFRLLNPVLAGDELVIWIQNIAWQGKKGSAVVNAWSKDKAIKVAAIRQLFFRANSEKVARRLGFRQAA